MAHSRRFIRGCPVGCEITGLALTSDGRTMFVNIQHPREPLTPRSDGLEVPNLLSDPAETTRYSNRPDFEPGGRPRSATVAIRRKDGGPIGTRVRSIDLALQAAAFGYPKPCVNSFKVQRSSRHSSRNRQKPVTD